MEITEQNNIKRRIAEIYCRNEPPRPRDLLPPLENATGILRREHEEQRPVDAMGLPGGIIYLFENRETIIIPDIHGRLDFLLSLLFSKNIYNKTVIDQLADGLVQIVCVGDGMHAESRAAKRWKAAKDEYTRSYKKHANMDNEMRESLGVMEMIFELKNAFPRSFHYLKGNHDNIANEKGNGNYPFMKFAFEGPMVTEYMMSFYGIDFIKAFYTFEKNLPLLAVGQRFIISHSEPAVFFSFNEVLNYRRLPEVIEGLTWTDDDCAEAGSVEKMLAEFLDPVYAGEGLYFGGHRPVKGLYNKRAGGHYIQIHNPHKSVIAKISPYRNLDPDEIVIEIEDVTAGQETKVM